MLRRFLGPVRRFDELDSTNRYLADEARAGAPGGLVSITGYQTAGRGRLDRRWEAPAGANLLMSVLLRPRGDVEPFHFTVAMALAASDACRETAGVEPWLKWPNDLVVDGKLDPQPVENGWRRSLMRDELKLAGILAELVADSGGRLAVVVGLGLNVGWPVKGKAVVEMAGATSLGRVSEAVVDPQSLAEAVLDQLDHRVGRLQERAGALTQMDEYRRRCVTIGKTVQVEERSDRYTGSALGITDEGHLLVRSFRDQGTHEVTAGDVVHVGHVRLVAS
jgi:BirA family transcriptional regulator, biotin operon repressor / biotin---[acetyl-CoA-carboxylase] ligase